MVEKILILFLSYLIGSIPTGYLIARSKGIDIRVFGSGNIGATNVYRTLGARFGIMTFIFDLLKGFLPVYACGKIFNNDPYILIFVGISAVIGHVFSVFMSFKGGKGVATSTGVFLAIAPYAVIVSVVVFFMIVKISKIVSISSLISSVIFLIVLFKSNVSIEIRYFATAIVIIIFITHIPNIKRLLKGQEFRYNKD